MWLKTLKIDDKVLSPIELLVLLQASSIDSSDQAIDATEIMDQLNKDVEHWSPERGTIYPILNRLTSQNLLHKIATRPMRVVRTEEADMFIDTLVNSDLLTEQYEASFSYLKSIAKAVVQNSFISTLPFLESIETMVEEFQDFVVELKEQAEKDEDDWTEINVD